MSGLSQNLMTVKADTLRIHSIDYNKLDTISNFSSLAYAIVVDSSACLMQVGHVEILRINVQDGTVEETLNMQALQKRITDLLLKYDKDLFITKRSTYKGRVKPEHFPISFGRIKKYGKDELYYTMTSTVVTRVDTAGQEKKFKLNALLILDLDLEIVEFIPFVENQKLKLAKYPDRGGFFYDGFLITLEPSELQSDRYIMLKFQKSEDGIFIFQDTLDQCQSIYWQPKRGVLKDQYIVRSDSIIYPLEREILILQHWNDTGYILELPLEKNQYIDHLIPLYPGHWYASIIYEYNREYHNGRYIGDKSVLVLVDEDLTTKLIIHEFEALDVHILSLSIHDNTIKVLAEDRRKKEFVIFGYTLDH